MTTRAGVKCPDCPKVVYGGSSQWDAHARIHTYLAAGRRRWVTTTPWWEWAYELLAPDDEASRLWVERTPANWPAGVKSTYVVHRLTAERGEEVLVLEAAGLKEAKKQAAALLDVANWGPMLSLQERTAA